MTLYPRYIQAGRQTGTRTVWLRPARSGAQYLYVATAGSADLADLIVMLLCAHIAAERLLATHNPPPPTRRKALPAPRAKCLPAPRSHRLSRLTTPPLKGRSK